MSIKSWPIHERPREKLLEQGAQQLSDTELLAIFIRSGLQGKTAVDLARELILQFGSFKALLKAEFKDFCRIPGLGIAKYAQLQAALEISKRYLYEDSTNQEVLTNPRSVKKFLISHFRNHKREVFACIYLNNKNRVIGFKELFFGSINRADIYPREIVKSALEQNAAAVIFVHNHTSGDPTPSDADREITKVLKKALEIVEIKTLDHMVIGEQGCFSLAEFGWA
ncbi:MAG: DNA repair protein RadC [Gammaproteobacteria bacterium]|nr:DNA repair protein RadC [Gammaproteobacteria bacterium]MBU1558683.1 DNA repair protein RadC [Gammaproteobacteria bacterium]MBU1628882.1 DNA repair protein RadC [Gammaproteobacteria bacterium]MBU1926194.1 DNA repair protein RadC [Gammaproteobacteria bacterium]MBU2545552.1 DNA repair protein RadC [Gammaproteobacteria bacterium]